MLEKSSLSEPLIDRQIPELLCGQSDLDNSAALLGPSSRSFQLAVSSSGSRSGA
jgi:hypothetical protein